MVFWLITFKVGSKTDTPSKPYLADELLGIQEQLHDHNLHTLDFEIWNFEQTRKAHQI